MLCSVLLSNVQLQIVFRVVKVPELPVAVGALDVRRRLAARAEVLVLLQALGLDHATDSAAVLDHATVVLLFLTIKHKKVIVAMELPRGAMPGVLGLGVRLLGGLQQLVHHNQVPDLKLARVRRGLDRNVWHRVELVEDCAEGPRRSATGSEDLDEALRKVACELWGDGVGEVGGQGGGRGRLLGRLLGRLRGHLRGRLGEKHGLSALEAPALEIRLDDPGLGSRLGRGLHG